MDRTQTSNPRWAYRSLELEVEASKVKMEEGACVYASRMSLAMYPMMPHDSHLHLGKSRCLGTNLSLDVLDPYRLSEDTKIRRAILLLP